MEQYTNLTGDGTTKTFYFTFPFFGVNDIHVKVNGVAKSTDDYTLTPTQTPNDADTEYTGGSIEFTTAPANGATITIYREIDLVRHIDYQPTEKPLSHQLNQDFNQCIGALRELKIKLQNVLNLATIPTLADLLAELTTIRESLPNFLTADELSDINDAIDNINDTLDTLSSKANTNLDNLSTTGKENVIKYVMPNYSATTSISLTNNVTLTWTAPCDCLVYVQAGNNASSGVAMARIQAADGTDISRVDLSGTHVATANAFVNKGDTVKLTAKGNSSIIGHYFALKGI